MKKILFLLFTLGVTLSARAEDLAVSGAWARPTVEGQGASGVFMTIRSTSGARVVAVHSSVAAVAQVHEMVMNGPVMTMHALSALELPPQKSVVLSPGGMHIMLQDLKRQLRLGEHFQVVLDVIGADSQSRQHYIEVEVRNSAPDGP